MEALAINVDCRGAEPNGNGLPLKAMKLARRAAGLNGRGVRYTLELIVDDSGRWLLMVNGGEKVEDLGRD